MDRLSPGPSPSTSATLPPPTNSISPLSAAMPHIRSHTKLVVKDHTARPLRILPDEKVKWSSLVLHEVSPGASGSTAMLDSPRIIARKRKRRNADLNGEYTAFSLRGGGRPQKSRAKRNHTDNTVHQPQTLQNSRRTTRSKARRAGSPSDVIITSLEEIKLEDVSVKSEITRLGLTLRDVQGDGNCLFRCLSDQLYGTEKHHLEMRKLVCDYLYLHKDTMQGFVVPFMREGEEYDGYVERMRQSKQFGSHIEIQAAARIFKRDIRVVMSTASFTIPWYAESPSLHVARKHGHTHRRDSVDDIPDSIPSPIDGRTMLWLALFSQAEHFQSIRRLGDKENGSAGVEDRLAIPHEKDTSEAARRARGELLDESSTKKPSQALVSQVMASLPARHNITLEQAQDVLARVKGNLGEAVEILLEEVNFDAEDASEVSSDKRVEDMLCEPGSLAASLNSKRTDYRELDTKSNSPALSSTTGTRSRSTSLSDKSRVDSEISDDAEQKSVSSGYTTISEGSSIARKQVKRQIRTRSSNLGKNLAEMALGSRGNSRERIDPAEGGKKKGLRSSRL
nr:hypothetical protein L204_01550 [Cryptococcus depauperatus CBS 7855]